MGICFCKEKVEDEEAKQPLNKQITDVPDRQSYATFGEDESLAEQMRSQQLELDAYKGMVDRLLERTGQLEHQHRQTGRRLHAQDQLLKNVDSAIANLSKQLLYQEDSAEDSEGLP